MITLTDLPHLGCFSGTISYKMDFQLYREVSYAGLCAPIRTWLLLPDIYISEIWSSQLPISSMAQYTTHAARRDCTLELELVKDIAQHLELSGHFKDEINWYVVQVIDIESS